MLSGSLPTTSCARAFGRAIATIRQACRLTAHVCVADVEWQKGGQVGGMRSGGLSDGVVDSISRCAAGCRSESFRYVRVPWCERKLRLVCKGFWWSLLDRPPACQQTL